MFSTPPHPSGATTKTTARHQLATTAFRSAGLLDGDVKMGDQPRPPAASTSQSSTLREKQTATRHGRQRIYERPKIAEKDRAGKQIHPNAARIAARTTTGTLASIRGTTTTLSTPPPRSRARNHEVERIDSAAVNAHNKTKGSNIGMLRGFIQKRWNPESKFLNLEKLAEDPIWAQNKLFPPDHEKASRDIGAVLLKLASQLVPGVETLSVAHNGFRELRQFSTLHHYLPSLRNLSFQDNDIRSIKELNNISSRKEGQESQLRELILLDNHFRNLAVQGNTIDAYRSDVLRRFPNLVMLDQEPVTKIGFDVPAVAHAASTAPDTTAATEFPVEMGPAIVPTGVDVMAAEFLNKFFTFFDSSRGSLVDAYVPNATFSFAANTSIPPRARIKGYHGSKDMPNQRNLQWSSWLEAGSRNLTRINAIEKTARALHSTVEDILKVFKALPATKHDLAEQAKFMVDAWPVSGVSAEPVLFMTVHGQFTELPSMGIRSFDRSFMLAAAAEGSRAKSQGWPCVILSDQLVIRSYSNHEAWAPGPLRVQPDSSAPSNVPTTSSAPPLHPALVALPEPRRLLVSQVQQQTGLNVDFAIQCLDGNGWDLQRALANFQELRANIPAEAFMQ